MYVSVTTFGLEDSRVGDLVTFYEHIIDYLQGVKGWQQLYVLSNEDTGQGQVIAIWDNESNAYAFETGGHWKAITTQLAAIVSGPPDRQVYQVIYQGRRASPEA